MHRNEDMKQGASGLQSNYFFICLSFYNNLNQTCNSNLIFLHHQKNATKHVKKDQKQNFHWRGSFKIYLKKFSFNINSTWNPSVGWFGFIWRSSDFSLPGSSSSQLVCALLLLTADQWNQSQREPLSSQHLLDRTVWPSFTFYSKFLSYNFGFCSLLQITHRK